MRILSLLIAGGLATGLVFAGTTYSKTWTKTTTTHDMTVEVVSVDVKAKTITFKDDKGETQTASVLRHAVAKLGTLNPGETITLTCQDNEWGVHQGISAIHVAVAAKK